VQSVSDQTSDLAERTESLRTPEGFELDEQDWCPLSWTTAVQVYVDPTDKQIQLSLMIGLRQH
jgi:hypothetical protein